MQDEANHLMGKAGVLVGAVEAREQSGIAHRGGICRLEFSINILGTRINVISCQVFFGDSLKHLNTISGIFELYILTNIRKIADFVQGSEACEIKSC